MSPQNSTTPPVDTAIGRRGLLGAAAAGGTVLALTPAAAAHADTSAHTHPVRTDPFALGVASGDPLPDSVILWTRLYREGGFPRRDIEVEWELSRDPRFRRRVREGHAVASYRLGHSVHVDVRGLRPGTEYWYRFRTGKYVSPAGRTRTAPAAGAAVGALRLAVANCQDYQNGYWPAYTALADEDLDLVLHLGDYIYEYDPAGAYPDRRHTTPRTPGLDQLSTLADYRDRHAQYKLDPALQAAHAAAPWIATWDDHEVENNYADLIDEIDDTGDKRQTLEQFKAQRAAGYQAYYENLPIRARLVRGSADLRIFRRFDFGSLARFSVLDTRQYRTEQPGGFPQDFGPEAAGLANPGTLTGQAQETWLQEGLTSSATTWNVIAQQVMMGRTRFPNPFPNVPLPFLTNLDQWDGYSQQRARVLRFLAENRVSNPIVLAGDIHSTWVNDLPLNFDDPDAPAVATEFVSTSISSDFPAALIPAVQATNAKLNPRTRYFQGAKRGYLRMEITPQRWLTEERVVESIATRQSPVSTSAAFVVEAGSPGAVPA